MNALELAIVRERHNATLWDKLRPEEAARSEVRIHEMQEELAALRQEETEVLERFSQENKPTPKDTPVLSPMGLDEYIAGQWIYDDENQSRRPR